MEWADPGPAAGSSGKSFQAGASQVGNAAFEVYAIGVFIASLGSILLGAFSWFGAKREYARPFSLMQFAIFVWCFFGYSQLRVSGLGEQVAYLKLEYIGIASLPVAALAFARSLARRPLSGRTALLLLALPALTVLLVAVGGEPGLVWTPVGQDAKGRLLTEAGPWFWVHSAYSYVLVTACFANLVARAREVQGSTRRWLRHSIAILLIPVFTNLVFVLFFLKTTPLDPTPMAFALSGLLLAIGLRNYNIFDLVPYAKEAILAAIDNPILTVDADRLVVGANAPALALFAGLGAIEGRPLSALAGEDAGSALLAAAEASLREGGAREWRLRDRYYHLVSFALPTALGASRDFILIFYDETERTRALLALEERERALERYASMVNASHEFMSIVGRDLRYEAVNDAFCERYGKCRDDILGATVSEVWGEEAAGKYILPYLESCFAGEYRVIRNRFAFVGEEKERHFEVSYNPVRDASGSVTHAVVITKDVGDYVEAQEALAVAREKADAANAAKSSFLAAMSHEIRTPLNAIIGLTELSLRAPLSAEQRDNLETVRMAGGTLINIINDILDLSKIEAGRMTLERVDFDLPAHLAQVLKTFKPAFARKGLYLEFEAAPGSPRFVAGDSLRLGQVLMNLVGNAAKFTEKGGVRVRLEAEAAGEGKAGIRVSVADTGIGIPPDKLDLIFESFSQADSSVSRRYGGTGLGLSICRNLVGLFGGRIWVESEPGKGSTFSFTAFLEPGDEAKAAARVRPGEGEGEAAGGGPSTSSSPRTTSSTRRWPCAGWSRPATGRGTRSPGRRRSAFSRSGPSTSSSWTSRCPTSTAWRRRGASGAAPPGWTAAPCPSSR